MTVQQPPERILGMLFALAQPVPDPVVEVEIEARQDHATARGPGHRSQHIGGGRGRTGRAGGDDRLGRGAFGPGVGQKPQQPRAAPGRIDQPHALQPLRPGLDRQTEKSG